MTDIAVRAPFLKLRRAFDQTASFVLWLLLVALAPCQLVIWLQPETPRLAVLEQFALQLGGLALIGALLSLVLRRWRRLALFALLAVTLLWPVVSSRNSAAALPDPARLKIISANLWHSARGHDLTIQTLMASDADIIGLVEATRHWQAALAPLIAKYPYHVDCFDSEPDCQTLLLSKLPIEKSYAGRVWSATPIVAGGEIVWNGRPITILVTHLFRPLAASADSLWGGDDPERASYMADRLPLSRQAGQAGLLARYVDSLPDDLVLMGDFNGVPWSRVQRAFRETTRLDNQAGWDLTWPALLPAPLRLPIDHILARGHLVVTDFKAGPKTDSDHFPVIAEIGWR